MRSVSCASVRQWDANVPELNGQIVGAAIYLLANAGRGQQLPSGHNWHGVRMLARMPSRLLSGFAVDLRYSMRTLKKTPACAVPAFRAMKLARIPLRAE